MLQKSGIHVITSASNDVSDSCNISSGVIAVDDIELDDDTNTPFLILSLF